MGDECEYIPQISNKCFTAKCLCMDTHRCGNLSKSFRQFEDLRGSFVQFPMLNESPRFHVQHAVKTKKAERFSLHLNIPNPFEMNEENNQKKFMMIDRRNRKKIAGNEEKDKGIQRRRLFIALHHFHPKLINPKYGIARVDCDGSRFKLPDVVSKSKIEALGLTQFFSKEDSHNDQSFIIIPNYSLSMAERDLSRLSVLYRAPRNNIYHMSQAKNALAYADSTVKGSVMKRSTVSGTKRSIDNTVSVPKPKKSLKSDEIGESTNDVRKTIAMMNEIQLKLFWEVDELRKKLLASNNFQLNLLQSNTDPVVTRIVADEAVTTETLTEIRFNNLQKSIVDTQKLLHQIASNIINK